MSSLTLVWISAGLFAVTWVALMIAMKRLSDSHKALRKILNEKK